MNILEKYDKPFEYGGIVIKLLIAYQFYTLWTAPNLSDATKISDLAILMAFEFIMVHSGVFMAVMPKKITLYVLVPLYALFAFVFNLSVSNNTIILLYLMVVFNRMRFAFSDVSKAIKQRAIFTSVSAAFIYFVLIFVVLFSMDYLPELGLNANFLEVSGYNKAKTSGGVFIDTPHIAIVFGFIYYSILAIVEALLINKGFSKK